MASQDVQASVDRVTSAMGLPRLVYTEVRAGAHDDGLIGDETIALSAHAIAFAHDRKELEAMLAVLIGFRISPDQIQPDSPSIGSYLAAGAVAYAGRKLDRVDPADAGMRNRQSFVPPLPDEAPSLAQRRSGIVLSALGRLTSCSGAAVAVLRRIKDERDHNPALALLPINIEADLAIRDLGPAIYPPDNSCL